MQQSNAPSKIYVPFAQNDSSKVNVPITTTDATRASQSLGFPPLTGQPPESGGVPPQLEDFNGAINQIASIAWWVMGGNFYQYDATFAASSYIGGYANGAKLLRLDNTGDWLNTVDNNVTNPDATDGTAANWTPGYNYGAASISITSSTVTVQPVVAAKKTLTLTGTLSANTTVTLPAWLYDWTVINNTAMVTFTLLLNTASGTGVYLQPGVQRVRGDGTNIVQVPESIAAATLATQPPQLAQLQRQSATVAAVSGTAPAYVATLAPVVAGSSIPTNLRFNMTFATAGTYGSNTINVGVGGAIAVKQFDSNGALQPANIPAGLNSDVWYNGTFFVLLDPAPTQTSVVGTTRNLKMLIASASASATLTADEIVVETALGGMAYKLASFSKTINLASTGAGGMDTGTAPVSGYVALYAIYNPTTGVSALLATNATAAVAGNVYGGANMPSGYTASALVSVWPTTSGSLLVIGTQRDRKVSRAPIAVFTATSISTGLTSLSISSTVPPNATAINGYAGTLGATATNSYGINVAADISGSETATIACYLATGASGLGFFSVSLSAIQTMYYGNGGSPTSGVTWYIAVGAYTF